MSTGHCIVKRSSITAGATPSSTTFCCLHHAPFYNEEKKGLAGWVGGVAINKYHLRRRRDVLCTVHQLLNLSVDDTTRAEQIACSVSSLLLPLGDMLTRCRLLSALFYK